MCIRDRICKGCTLNTFFDIGYSGSLVWWIWLWCRLVLKTATPPIFHTKVGDVPLGLDCDPGAPKCKKLWADHFIGAITFTVTQPATLQYLFSMSVLSNAIHVSAPRSTYNQMFLRIHGRCLQAVLQHPHGNIYTHSSSIKQTDVTVLSNAIRWWETPIRYTTL